MEVNPDVPTAELEAVFEMSRAHLASMDGISNVVLGSLNKSLLGIDRQFSTFENYTYALSLDFDNEAARTALNTNEQHLEIHRKFDHMFRREIVIDINDE
jgi:hypothetical protein